MVVTDVSGKPIVPMCKGQAVQEETPVTKYQCMRRNVSDEGRSQAQAGASLK